MKSSFKTALLGSAAAVIGVAGIATSAQAQLDEIIVTAQKREQSLQDVPIAVSAFSGEALALSGVQNIEDLTALAPSLSINTTNTPGSTTTIRIRGIGTTGNNLGLEAAVGFFMDGVYRSRSGTAINDLIDIERIEVLRGPQGTLFGKNTSAGAIVIHTKKPTDEFEAFGDVSFGNYNSQRVRGVVNVPLIDGILSSRWSAQYNRRDGFIENIIDGRDHNDRDRYNLRGQLLWTPTEDIELRVIAEHFESEEDFGGVVRHVNGPTSGLAPVFSGREFDGIAGPGSIGSLVPPSDYHQYVGTANDVNFGGQMDQQISGELNWDFGFATLTSITAYRYSDTDTNQDVDFINLDVLTQDATIEQELFTQEVRLSGSWEEVPWMNNVDWQFGGFFARENLGRTGFLRNEEFLDNYLGALFMAGNAFEPLFPELGGEHLQTGQNGKSYSVFGHLDMEVLDWLSVVGGARFNREQKTGGMSYQSGNPIFLGMAANPFVAPQYDWRVNEANGNNISESEWTGNVAVQVHWTDDIQTYISYAHGYKAGGLNLDRGAAATLAAGLSSAAGNPTGLGVPCSDPTDSTTCAFPGTTFNAEFADTYEFGVKATLWDGRATINATVFDTRFTDFQLNTFTGLGFFITNAGVVNSRGFEVEAQVSPVEGLVWTGGITFADAQYADDVDASSGADGPLGDGQLTNSSKWQGVTTATYRTPLPNTGGLEGFLHGELYFRSRRNTGSDLDPIKDVKGWSKYNGRIGIAAEDQSWEAALWCRNCGDKTSASVIFDSVGQGGSYDAFLENPREWGIQLNARY